MTLTGLSDLTIWGYIALTLGLTHITIVSVTVFLHRHQAHKALNLHPLLSHFFRFWLWLTTGMVTREWVAIHRKHHAKCETEDDPHSPQTRGIGEVLCRGAELYQSEAANQETLDRYGKGTPDDWLERHIYTPRHYHGVSLLLVIQFLLFGPAGVAIWALQMIWIPFWAAGVINGIGHYWGYRNFEIPNASTNILPWGLLIGGEELHNNHHAYASSAKLSIRPWEFDIGWFYIRLFSLFRLARVHKVAPAPQLIPARPQLDMDAVRSLTVNRLQLLSDYRRRVLQPVFRAEINATAHKSWKRLYRKARHLAKRDLSLLNEKERQRLRQVLENSSTLKTVYQLRIQLQDVWEQQASSHETRLESLRQWCTQAESSGIQALEEFVQLMRRYELKSLTRPGDI
ncbi:MAG: transposase [Candidatus Thiodiazotropha sp. (ex Monitilora ramsayi)]|nr:transposase [Candidatus Thiodiazotropha sp. (ex Monitilora ramsayi)]